MENPYIVDFSHGSFKTTANKTFKSLTKPTPRMVTWYWSAFVVCLIFYLSLYLYFLDKNDNSYTTPRPRAPGMNIFPPLETLYQRMLQNKFPTRKQIIHQLEQDFRDHWCRQRKSRVNWKRVLEPCWDNMAWGRVKAEWDKSQRTSASKSTIPYLDIRPAGEFSRIFIQSRTRDGQTKLIGGDSWRVYVRGPSSIAATVFDHNNGTYEALFLLVEPGTYTLEVILDFSLCDGFRDPPFDWFIKGNHQGKKQEEGMLGYLDDYLLEKIDRQLSINITRTRLTKSIEGILSEPGCGVGCNFLIDGYGRWINNTKWVPFIKEGAGVNQRLESGRGPSGFLVSYGDSLALRFGSSLARNKKLCGELYQSCSYRYNWIYPVGNEQVEMRKKDDFDFNEVLVLHYIRQLLEHPAMDDTNSTLVINIGLHFSMSINFTTYQHLIDKAIGTIFLQKQSKHKARIIWKTTTAITKEHAVSLNATKWRFFTAQRILLFNSYATWAMCKAGIPVLDVHPVTDSYASGASDVVHYPDFVFSNAEKALEFFKTNELNGKKRFHRTKLTSNAKSKFHWLSKLEKRK